MPPTITVKLEGGGATVIQDPNPATLKFGDQVTIGIEKFPQNTKITEVNIYANSGNKKGSLIGTWKKSNPNKEPIGELTVLEAGNSVTLKDSDSTSDKVYWYGLTMTDGTQTWNPDPELIVKKQE